MMEWEWDSFYLKYFFILKDIPYLLVGVPLLYLGGGQTRAEVYSLPALGEGDDQIVSPNKTSCFIDQSPHESHSGSVAFVINGIFTECGEKILQLILCS